MNTIHLLLSTALLATSLVAQTPDFLFTTSQNERTMTNSGGTVLRFVQPNDIMGLQAFPCPSRAEKWAPRSAFDTMAGDEDGDDNYFEPGLFGSIDALMITRTVPGAGVTNARLVWYSVSVPTSTSVSGGVGLRPGDIGHIVRNGAGDGQVEYFIRAEQIQIALGLPPTPVLIDVDAATWGPNQGLFLSLDADIACAPCGGPTLLRDGDVFCIPPSAYTMTSSGTIGGVVPNSAVVVYTEAQIDAMVSNAMVTDRFGTCVTTAVDLESLDIDWGTPSTVAIPGCTGTVVFVPTLLFSTETLTGGAILSTAFGGSIYNGACSPLGTTCGGGPTLGNQIGLRPPTAALGIPSYVNALASTRIFEFAAEAVVPQIPVFTSGQIDFASPGALTWVFMTFAPSGPAVVAPSAPFVWGMLGHPDYYPTPFFMGVIPTATGFGSYTTPPIPWVCDLVFQGVTITSAGTIEASTPTMLEVY